MHWPIAVVMLTSGLGIVLIATSSVLLYSIRREVNKKSPEGQAVGFWLAGTRYRNLLNRHANLFPLSKKRSQMYWFSAVGALLLASATIFNVVATHLNWITS